MYPTLAIPARGWFEPLKRTRDPFAGSSRLGPAWGWRRHELRPLAMPSHFSSTGVFTWHVNNPSDGAHIPDFRSVIVTDGRRVQRPPWHAILLLGIMLVSWIQATDYSLPSTFAGRQSSLPSSSTACARPRISSLSIGRVWPRGGFGPRCGCSTTVSPPSGSPMAEGHPSHYRQAGRRPRPRRADRASLRHALGVECKGVLSGNFAGSWFNSERDRERLQRKVVEAVDRLEAEGVLREMRRATKRILRKAAIGVAKTCRPPPAYAQTRRHILRQLDELLRHQDSLADPDDQRAAPCHADRRQAAAVHAGNCPARVSRTARASRRSDQAGAIALGRCSRLRRLGRASRRVCRRASASASRRCLAMPAGLPACSRESTICGRIGAGIASRFFEQLVEYWAELGRRRFWEDLASVVLAGGSRPATSDATADATTMPNRQSPAATPSPRTAAADVAAGGRARHARLATDCATDRAKPGRLLRGPLLTAGS